MSLHLEDLRKRYGSTVAVDGVDLEVHGNETLALLGPSGCGKSTLLRLVAGLERPDAGTVAFEGADLTRTPPQARGFGMVFQDYALFPHLDVHGNVAFGLVEAGWGAARRRSRVEELLELVGLTGLQHRRIGQLSGGQQQRVALARALAPQPRVLLLDEPLSNLDQTLRESLKRELEALLGRLEIRSIYVTHDQGEALAMGDRIAVMREGRLVQVGPPLDVLERPADAWTAGFLGYRNVIDRAALERIPNAPKAHSAVLRDDLVGLGPPEGDGVPAIVAGVRRVGLAWELDLRVDAWSTSLRWEGFARELPGRPAPGDEVRLRIPERAWIPLEEPS